MKIGGSQSANFSEAPKPYSQASTASVDSATIKPAETLVAPVSSLKKYTTEIILAVVALVAIGAVIYFNKD